MGLNYDGETVLKNKSMLAAVAIVFLPLSTSFSTPQVAVLSNVHLVGYRAHRVTTSISQASLPTDSENEENKMFEPLGLGIKRDFQRRFPLYKSDILDGINSQSLASTLFLFFACLAPAIGFGGILGIATGGAMGAIEMVSSTAVCGVVYALCSAQPLQLIGPMGPNLAFTISLAQLANHMTLPFLPLYAWTGLWTAGMLLLCALTSACNAVQHLTRFTDEIFSVLISTIFIWGSITDVASTFSSPSAIKALLALTCATVTFGTAIILKGLKTSVLFNKPIRENLSNFAPAIGVTVGSLVARAARLKYGPLVAGLPVLALPTQFATTTGRPWLIPLMDLPVWARWGACLPAFLATVLLFLDQNITARLVNHPGFNMVKGRTKGNVLDGMHGDMLVLSLLTGLTSMVGLPWMAGATTRSAAHVRSLLVVDESGTIQGALENRLSGATIHALIGACVVFARPRMLLSQVPLPVLSGIFLYLGLTSLQGLDLWNRIQGLFRDSSIAPKPRLSVPKATSTLVTLVQITCVGVMMGVTKSKFGVISPLLIAMLPLLRLGLMKSGLVPTESMKALDE